MLMSNFLFRTFHVRFQAGPHVAYGTAFSMDVDGEEFMVTAKHLLGDTPLESLKIMQHEAWHELQFEVIGRGKGEVDIAVLKVGSRLTIGETDIQFTMAEIQPGQDVYFLGFPFKLAGWAGDLIGGLPAPYVKKGTLSWIDFRQTDRHVLHIDAINNEGFSGGPVIFYRNGQPQQDSLRIAGVVSKYRVEHEPVLDQDGNQTGMTVAYNTGFLIAYGIASAHELIAAYRGRVN